MTTDTKMNIDNIESLRKEIDILDKQIVDLLNQRANLASAISKIKLAKNLPIFDPQREDKILEMITNLSDGSLSEEGMREIYSVILKWMKESAAK